MKNIKIIYIYTIGFIILICMIGLFYSQNYTNKNINNNSKDNKQEFIEENNNIVIGSLDVKSFKEALKTGEYILIDIRTKEELKDIGVIGNPDNIDFYDKNYKFSLNILDKNKKYLIYCRSGNRTGQTLKIMKEMGFKNVSDLKGGIKAWIKSGEKLIKYKNNK